MDAADPEAEPATGTLSATQVTALLDAMTAVGREVRLETVLRRVVASAAALVGAQYAALGILDPTGTGLEDFLHVGLSDEQAERIGSLPEGRGVLGHVITDPRPLRLEDLATHHGAAGFPAHHPPMTSFLGVPVRVRGEVFGNLYLCEKHDGTPFTEGDEKVVTALGAVAAMAVENSRLHDRVSGLAVTVERERIARSLHDTVIQRIFSIGLALEGIATRVDDPALTAALDRAAADLDETVGQIRSTVFDLDGLDDERRGARRVGRELTELMEEVTERLGIKTSVRVHGDLDQVAAVESHGPLVHDLFATARDAVFGLHQDQQAGTADLSVTVGPELTLHITSDAAGFGGDAPPAWLAAIEQRAESSGGRALYAADGSGIELIWSIPLASPWPEPYQ